MLVENKADLDAGDKLHNLRGVAATMNEGVSVAPGGVCNIG